MLKTIETIVQHWVTLIKAHEKLLLAAILALVVWHYGDKAFDAYGNYLNHKQTADNEQIAQLAKQNADTAAQLAQMTAQFKLQLAVDEAKIANAKQTIIVKQKEDAALPLPELSAHWQQMLALPENSIIPQTNGTVSVTTDAAHTTVNELEKVGPLTDQLIATQDELKGCTTLSAKKDTDIVGLNNEIIAQKKARSDDAAAAKQAQRKSFLKGFKYGFITGAAVVGGAVIAILK